MLKLFPLPLFLASFARQRLVNVAVFGSGLSTVEWPQVCASFWHNHDNFVVNLVSESSEADVLAIHGPLTESSWPFFERWMQSRLSSAKVLVVGMEVATSEGHILTPEGVRSEFAVDAILPGHPPTPGALKASLAELLARGASV